MKKIIKNVLIVIILILLLVCINIKLSEKNSIPGNVYGVGHLDIPIEERKILITNYQEYIQYFNKWGINTYGEIWRIYNEEFFYNKQLAIIYQPLGSGMYSVEYRKCEIKDEVAYIEYKYITPKGYVTMDMNGSFVIVELPKDVTAIETEVIYKNK